MQGEAALADLTIRGDDDDEDATGSQTDDLEVLENAHTRPRVLHEGHLMSDLGEQAHGTLHDVIDVDGLR